MDEYEFNYQAISKDLVILLSIFNASQTNNSQLRENNLKVISFVEWEIIQEKVIASAIKIRMINDKEKEKISKIDCINWIQGRKKDKDKTDLREACNKIIHAKKIDPQNRFGSMVLDKCINLQGKKGKDHWEVELDVTAYVTSGLIFLKSFLA